MPDFIRIRNPRGERKEHGNRVYPTLDTLEGKTLVVLNNTWTSMDEISKYLGETMKERYGISKHVEIEIPVGKGADDAVIAEAARIADFAVVGLAN